MHSHGWDALGAVFLCIVLALVLANIVIYSGNNHDRIEDLATRIEALEAAR